MSLHALIIAGGSGTRFWPQSRRAMPKQFLRLSGGERSLLAETHERIATVAEKVWIVCGRAHAALVRTDLPELPAAQILCEPEAKNTAPAIAFALRHIIADDLEATVVVLPADHFVKNDSAFRSAVSRAETAAKKAPVLTLGIVPERADTGFGYIEHGAKEGDFFRVKRFVEKPPKEDAERFVKSGNFSWNGGIFVFRADTMQKLFAEHAPQISQALDGYTLGDQPSLERAFSASPSISIDYAIMEKAAGVGMVSLDCGWSDVGSWDALPDVAGKDAQGNTLGGSVLALDSKGCIALGHEAGKKLVLLGVEDLIVVDTKDALLVMRRGEAQRVREAVAALEKTAPEKL